MKIQHSLSFFLLLLAISACTKEPQQKPCPDSKDYGLIALSEEALAYIPESYRNNEKLIFKNTAGEEITFFPLSDTIQRRLSPNSSVRRCGASEAVETSCISEQIAASYRSVKGHTFSILLKSACKRISSEQEEWQEVLVDLMELHFNQQVENTASHEHFCWIINIPVSYRGEEASDLGPHYENYSFDTERLIGGRLFTNVYTGHCDSGASILVQKQSGVIALTDIDGVEWVLERTEAFEEENAPDLALPDPAGQIVQLSAVEGRLILVDFWASWCGPCRLEKAETLKPLYAEYAEKGLSIYSVSLDTDRAAWIEAIAEDEVGWHHVSDLQGYSSAALAHYEVYGIPTIYVLDEQRKILSKNMRGEALKDFVKAYLD